VNSLRCRTRSLGPWFAAALATAVTIGCGGYGPVSRNAYDYATALYSATNGKASAKVDEIERRIQADRDAGELTPDEADSLVAIIADARGGEWQSAAGDCRALMEAQVAD
jgi:hypothetical protein